MLIDASLRSVRDRLLAVRAMPNYAGLPDASLLFIAESARERRFRAGEPLFTEAEALANVHFLIHGRVTTSHRGVVHQVLDAPGAVGILAALGGEPEGWGAVAEVDTLTLEVPADAFLDDLEEDFVLLRNSLRLIAGRVLDASGNLPLHPERAPPVVVGAPPERDPTLGERVVGMRANTRATPYANAHMDALVAMARRMRPVRLAPGELLFARGAPATFAVRIRHGRVRCTAASGEHVDVGPSLTLGSLDGFAARAHSYEARAMTDVIGDRLEVEASLAVFEMYPGLAMSVLRDLVQGLIRR